MAAVAGIDSSTQSTKVEIRDADTGKVFAVGRAPHPPTTPPRSEQDPQAWEDARREAWRRAGNHSVAAVSVAAQQHGLVVLGTDDEVVRPAKLWNDTESAPDAADLVERLGPEVWADACGSVPVASFTVTKLAWLARTEPATLERLASVLLPHDWLTYRLTGERVTDRGDASGTGYWSPAEGRWRTDLLEQIAPVSAWDKALPTVLGPTDPAGRWDGAVVAAGTGDNMAAALGLGLRPGDVVISLGTSGTVYAVSERPTADASGAVAGFADATGRFLPLVCTLNATKVTDLAARLLGVDADELARSALAAPAGAGGVVCVPYLDGERTPNRPGATGSFVGLRTSTTREQLARAAHEGVVCGLLDGLDALRRAGVAVDGGRLFVIGGGARSTAYRRVVADLTGREVTVPDAEEAVATGACVQAVAALTGSDPLDIARAWHLGEGRAVEPTPGVDGAAVREAYAAAVADADAGGSA